MSKKSKKQKRSEARDGLKTLFNYALPYKRPLFLIIILSLVLAAISAIAPILIGKVFDSVIDLNTLSFMGADYPAYILYLIAFAFSGLINLGVNYYSNLTGNLTRDRFIIDYKKKVSSRISRLPFSFHKEKKYGSWSTSVDRASLDIAKILFLDIKNILPSIIFFFLSIGILFSLNLNLGLVLLFGIVLFSYSIYRSNLALGEISEAELRESKKLNSKIFEMFSNILEVKKNSSENKDYLDIKKYAENKYLPAANSKTYFWQNTFLTRGTIFFLTRMSLLIFAVIAVLDGSMTIGDLLVVNIYSMRIFQPLTSIGNLWTYWYEALVRINDAEKILGNDLEVFEPEDQIRLPKRFNGEIEFENVEFSYENKENKVLKKVNLKIEKGQKVAFVGESGVGKSTAIDLIGGFYFPQKGSVKIDGIDSKKLGLEDLRSKIAFVSQDISLFNDTVENNIKYGSKRVNLEKVIEASKKAFAHDFIKDFPKKYKQKVGNRGIKLSGGQKQRISIARAILRDPKILILDEPTSSLDIKSEKYITESLDDLMKDRTTIIIAHRLSTVRNVDKIFVFKEGKIVEEGSHKELLALKGEYKNMHDMHIGLN